MDFALTSNLVGLPPSVLNNRFDWGLRDHRRVLGGVERHRSTACEPSPTLLKVSAAVERLRAAGSPQPDTGEQSEPHRLAPWVTAHAWLRHFVSPWGKHYAGGSHALMSDLLEANPVFSSAGHRVPDGKPGPAHWPVFWRVMSTRIGAAQWQLASLRHKQAHRELTAPQQAACQLIGLLLPDLQCGTAAPQDFSPSGLLDWLDDIASANIQSQQRRALRCALADLGWQTSGTNYNHDPSDVSGVLNRDGSGAPMADIRRLDSRLSKVAVWADRARKNRTAWLGLLRRGKSPLSALRLDCQYGVKGRSPEDGLRDVLQRFGSSSKLRLSDGYRQGLNTSGVTLLFSQVLTGLILRLRLIVKVSRLREAFVELGQNAHFMEINIGVTRQSHLGLGVVLGAGPSLGGLMVGGQGFVEPYIRKRSASRGVCIRIPIHRGENSAKDTTARILDLLMSGVPAGTSLTQQIWRLHPDVSICSLGHAHTSQQRWQAGLEAIASVGWSKLRLQAHAGLHWQSIVKARESSLETGGRIRVMRDKRGQSKALVASAGLRLGAGLSLNESLQGAASPGELVLLNARLGGADSHVRRELGQEDGMILKHSYFELEHSHPQDALRALRTGLQASNNERNPQGMAGCKGSWLALQMPGSRVGHAQRYELRQAVRNRLNSINACLQGWRGVAHLNDRAQALQQESDALIRSTASYQLASLRNYSRSHRLHRLGISLGFFVQRVRSAQSVSCI